MVLEDKNNVISKAVSQEQDSRSMKNDLLKVYNILNENGYNPLCQLTGYILTEDPTYITNSGNARSLIRHIDRNKLLSDMIMNYLNDAGDIK